MARAFDDASSQYLSNTSAVATAAPVSMACWFQTDATALGNAQRMMVLTDIDAIQYFSLHIRANAVGLSAQAYDGTSGAASNTGTINANTWHHACGVFTSTTSRFVYLDAANKLENTTTVSPSGISDTLLATIIRSDVPTGNGFVSGLLAEAAMWNVALSDAEVSVLATGVSPLFVRPASLIAYWPLIGRLSPEIDRVGGFDMTLNASPTTAAHPRVIYPVPQYPFVPVPAVSSIDLNMAFDNESYWRAGVQIQTP